MCTSLRMRIRGALVLRLQTNRAPKNRMRLTDVRHQTLFLSGGHISDEIDLDTAHLRYSYKQTCLVSLTIGDVQGHEEWHLPTYDPHNQNKYHYKLHSLDLYFWTPSDALQFVNGIRRVISPAQCEILDEPGPPPRASQPHGDMSSVVQHLERAAISDSSTPPINPGAPSYAPPPMSAVSSASPAAPPAFVPIPYNPAAPPAPEQIRHREKTPPPEDGDVSPLHATLHADSMTPFSPGLVPPAGYGSKGPLSPALVPPAHFHPPPGAPTFAPPPAASPAPVPHQHPGFGSLAAAAASPTPPPQHPGIARAVTMPVAGGYNAPGAWPMSPGLPPGTPGLPTPAPSAPPGGYSTYSYANSQATGGQDYSIHQQLYRPTEGEMGKTERRKKLEENAGRLEKGMTGMLKKFEKRFG